MFKNRFQRKSMPEKFNNLRQDLVSLLLRYFKHANVDVIRAVIQNLPLPQATPGLTFSLDCFPYSMTLSVKKLSVRNELSV